MGLSPEGDDGTSGPKVWGRRRQWRNGRGTHWSVEEVSQFWLPWKERRSLVPGKVSIPSGTTNF